MLGVRPVDLARAGGGATAPGLNGNAPAAVAEGEWDGGAQLPGSAPAPASSRSLGGAVRDEPARLVLVDGVAVMLAGSAGGSWRSGLVLAALSVPVLAAFRLYRRRLVRSVVDDAFRLLGAVVLACAAAGWVGQPVTPPLRLPGWLWWLAVAGWVVLVRAAAYAVLRRARASRPESVVVVGRCPALVRLAERLPQRRELGLRPVGFVGPARPTEQLPLPVLGPTEALDRVLAASGARHVIVGFGAAPDGDLVGPLRRFRQHGGVVFVVPRLFELNVASPGAEAVDGIPLLRLPPVPQHRWSWLAKRPLDLVGAAVGLVLAAPLLLACAIAVRRETGRDGVLFRQRRVGEHGRPFPIVKFRSLTPSSDAESQQRWDIGDDGRVGPVGRVLRRTSLDELPQLVNVLRGEMSLVGPRPERPFFVAQFGRRYRRYADRLRVPPGMTGWAQVHGLRGDTSIEDRAMLDNYYIENWSLGLDLKILLRTVAVVLGWRRDGP